MFFLPLNYCTSKIKRICISVPFILPTSSHPKSIIQSRQPRRSPRAPTFSEIQPGTKPKTKKKRVSKNGEPSESFDSKEKRRQTEIARERRRRSFKMTALFKARLKQHGRKASSLSLYTRRCCCASQSPPFPLARAKRRRRQRERKGGGRSSSGTQSTSINKGLGGREGCAQCRCCCCSSVNIDF